MRRRTSSSRSSAPTRRSIPGCSAVFTVASSESAEQLVIVAEINPKRVEPGVVGALRAAVSAEHGLATQAIALVAPGTIPKTSSGRIQRRATKAGFLERGRGLGGPGGEHGQHGDGDGERRGAAGGGHPRNLPRRAGEGGRSGRPRDRHGCFTPRTQPGRAPGLASRRRAGTRPARTKEASHHVQHVPNARTGGGGDRARRRGGDRRDRGGKPRVGPRPRSRRDGEPARRGRRRARPAVRRTPAGHLGAGRHGAGEPGRDRHALRLRERRPQRGRRLAAAGAPDARERDRGAEDRARQEHVPRPAPRPSRGPTRTTTTAPTSCSRATRAPPTTPRPAAGLPHAHQPRRRRRPPRDAHGDRGRRRQAAVDDRRVDVGAVRAAAAPHDGEPGRADLRGHGRTTRRPSSDVSGALGRGGYEGIQDDSAGNIWIVEDVGGDAKGDDEGQAPEQLRLPLRPAAPRRPRARQAPGAAGAQRVRAADHVRVAGGRRTRPTRCCSTATGTRCGPAG